MLKEVQIVGKREFEWESFNEAEGEFRFDKLISEIIIITAVGIIKFANKLVRGFFFLIVQNFFIEQQFC